MTVLPFRSVASLLPIFFANGGSLVGPLVFLNYLTPLRDLLFFPTGLDLYKTFPLFARLLFDV